MSEPKNKVGEILPNAYGHEMEISILSKTKNGWEEPEELLRQPYNYLPAGMIVVGEMLENGSRLYIELTKDKGNKEMGRILEWASPACATPHQLTTHIRGGEQFMTDVVTEYTETMAICSNSEAQSRVHMNVVDSRGATHGRHDNFGTSEQLDLYDKTILSSHLMTRSFVTGAGYITAAGLYFSEKVTGLNEVESNGHKNTMFRQIQQVGQDEAGQPASHRLEVRCNDHNINDWSTTVRIGTTALVLALARAEKLNTYTAPHYSVIRFTQDANRLLPTENNGIKTTANLLASVDHQQQIAELAMDELPNLVDLPDELFMIAHELYRYCDDFRKVLNGTASIESLSDRSDWAAKFSIINQQMKDRPYGTTLPYMGDMRSIGLSMGYYTSRIVCNPDSTTVKPGYGFVAKRRHTTRFDVDDWNAIEAQMKPPQDMRDSLRVQLMRTGYAVDSKWDYVDLKRNGQRISLEFPNPQQADFTESQRQQIGAFFDAGGESFNVV